MNQSPLLNNQQAADYLGLSYRTLPGLRRRGDGPVFVKLGGRRIGYLKTDLDAWVASRRRVSTSAITGPNLPTEGRE